MQPRISPMACIDLIRFFIIKYLQKLCGGFLQSTDDGQHLADGLHGLGQILHHGHLAYTSCDKLVGIRPPCSGQPSCQHHVCCILLADHATHLTDALHAADQILHNVHIIKTSK